MDDEQEVAVPEGPAILETDFDMKLRALALLVKQVEAVKENLKELERQKDDLSWRLAQFMLQTGCTRKTLDGVTFTQTQRVFSKVVNKELLRQWITDHDAVDLLMAVHPSKITGYVNECLENNTEIPAGVDPSFIKYGVKVKS